MEKYLLTGNISQTLLLQIPLLVLCGKSMCCLMQIFLLIFLKAERSQKIRISPRNCHKYSVWLDINKIRIVQSSCNYQLGLSMPFRLLGHKGSSPKTSRIFQLTHFWQPFIERRGRFRRCPTPQQNLRTICRRSILLCFLFRRYLRNRN